jgi:hypothetical protein
LSAELSQNERRRTKAKSAVLRPLSFVVTVQRFATLAKVFADSAANSDGTFARVICYILLQVVDTLISPATSNWQVFCSVKIVIGPETQGKSAIRRQEYLPIWDAKKAPREIGETVLRYTCWQQAHFTL